MTEDDHVRAARALHDYVEGAGAHGDRWLKADQGKYLRRVKIVAEALDSGARAV